MGQDLLISRDFGQWRVEDLQWERVFDYFFCGDRRILYIVGEKGKLLGILTLKDFLDNPFQLEKAINRNYFFAEDGSESQILTQARDIYKKRKILSELPIIDEGRHMTGYVTGVSQCHEEYNKKLFQEIKEKIEALKNSYFLKEELEAFYQIEDGTEIFIRQCQIGFEFTSLFDEKMKITFLSEREYLDLIKCLIRNINCRTDREKTCLLFDLDSGKRRELYQSFGLDFIYGLDTFQQEFLELVDKGIFSILLRITQTARYTLANFIRDNGMEDISFAGNRLLTGYLFRYMKKHNIPLTIAASDYITVMQVGCQVNGVRGCPIDPIGFEYCDMVEQQYSLLEEAKGKGVSVFCVSAAVHAKITDGERQRIQRLGRLENLIAEKNEKFINQLYQDVCKDQTPLEYAKELFYHFPVRRRFENDLVVNEDYASRYVNMENGIRRTCYQPEEYGNTIYFTGPCFAIGSFVEDRHTIPSFLARLLMEKGYTYRVVNLGVLASNQSKRILESLSLETGDIIICLMYNESGGEPEKVMDPSPAFNRLWPRKDMFWDKGVHCNAEGNKVYAQAIYDHIYPVLKKDAPVLKKFTIYNVFKPDIRDFDLYGAKEYLEMLSCEKQKIPKDARVIGSIVMNCNPFTLGHGHLVEYARKNCDYLFIFVVQEDKSFFRFKDRFAMAKAYCKQYDDVTVLPSGKMIVSGVSFPEYFKREVVRDQEREQKPVMVTPVMDFRLFAYYIAPVLGIRKRFVAEEPLDYVTREYNESMKRVLSAFDIQVEEISRKALPNGEVISASKVRKLYREQSFEKMRELLPDSTWRHLESLGFLNDWNRSGKEK